MKYLRTHEKYLIYKEGDYIIVNPNHYNITPFKYLKIVKVYSSGYGIKAISNDNIKQSFNNIEINKYDIFNFNIPQSDIIRLATPEEIEQFEIELNLNKFNL